MDKSLWDRLRADHGRYFMWVLVWLFTLSSVFVNGSHALGAMPAGAQRWEVVIAVVVAGFFPFAGLVMTEAVLIMIRSWRTGVWWIVLLQSLLVFASGAMLVVAFWRSFNALTAMAVTLAMPASDAWMLPVLTDTGIVVGTLGVVLAEVKIKLDEMAATSTTATHELVVVDVSPTPATGSSVTVDDPAASVDELSPPSPTSVTDDPGEWVADDLSTTARRAVDLFLHPATSGDELTDEWGDECRRVDADDPTTNTDELATTTPTGVTDDPGELVADELAATTASSVDDLDDECSRRARRVLAASQIAADADELATVLRMADAGASKQAIADAVGRSRSTVSGWLRVAGETPTLAAVR